MRTLTVKDILEKLQKLPPDMEVWSTWDESGESTPVTEKAFEQNTFHSGWLTPKVVLKRKMLGRLRYEEAHPVFERRIIKRSKSKKNVLII